MPTAKQRRVRKAPAYRHRKGYLQAIVTLTDSATKRRRDDWLGEHGTPGSRELYHRLIAEWEARLTPGQGDERKAHRWHAHQLRHNAATLLRREYGLEAAQLAVGHASAQITDAVYGERDRAKVVEIMREIG